MITTTGARGQQGLHRQRRRARRARRRLRPARGGGRSGTACTRSWSRSARTGSRLPASGSRTTGSRWGSTASTTAGSGSTRCGCRARRCSTGSPTCPRTAPTPARSRTRTAASSRCSAPSIQGRVCVGGAGINASKVALAIAVRYALRRRQFEATSEDEEELLLDYGQHQRRLFPLLADDLRAALRAGGRRRPVPPGVLRRGGRREVPPRARVARRRHQGARHLARDPHHPGVPRGVRRRGLPGREPVRRAQGRHRRVHHLRGRQHGPAPAGRQGAAHRLLLRASRTSTSSAWSGSSPGSRSRPWSSG